MPMYSDTGNITSNWLVCLRRRIKVKRLVYGLPIPANSEDIKLDWLKLQISLGVLAGLVAILIKSRIKEAKTGKGI